MVLVTVETTADILLVLVRCDASDKAKEKGENNGEDEQTAKKLVIWDKLKRDT